MIKLHSAYDCAAGGDKMGYQTTTRVYFGPLKVEEVLFKANNYDKR